MNKSINDLDVCIIGLGTIGKRYVRVFCENLNPRSLAVYDIDETKSIESASQHGIKMYNQTETMLEKENPDIVIVATPDSDHERPVKLALESNANVFNIRSTMKNIKVNSIIGRIDATITWVFFSFKACFLAEEVTVS